MPALTLDQIWEIITDRLLSIIESRVSKNCDLAYLAVNVLVMAGRDRDLEFMYSDMFKYWCRVAYLDVKYTRQLLEMTIMHIEGDIDADFYQFLR